MGTIPNPIPNDGILTDSNGRLTEQGWWYLESLRTGAVTALQNATISSVELIPMGGVVTPDISLSGPLGSFQLAGASPAITIDVPIFTSGSVPLGTTITIYYDQSSIGGDPAPIFATGPGGFDPNLNELVIVTEANTRTVYVLGYDGVTFTLKSFGTGLSI